MLVTGGLLEVTRRNQGERVDAMWMLGCSMDAQVDI